MVPVLTEEYLTAYHYLRQNPDRDDFFKQMEKQIQRGEDLRDYQVDFIIAKVKCYTDY